MTRAVSFASMVAVCFVGCVTSGGGGGGGGGGGSGSGSGSGSGGAISPQVGVWHYDEVTPVSSTCNAAVTRAESGDFGIDTVTAAGFRIVPNDGTNPFPCTSSGATFACPDRAAGTLSSGTAMVTYHATANGTFTDLAHATGAQQATVSCTGADCIALGTFPCQFTVDFVIHAL